MDSAELRRDAWRRIRPTGAVERVSNTASGWDAGSALADSAIDAGAGILLLIDLSAPSIEACATTALYANADATAVVASSGSDLEWMQECAAIRDAMVELRPLVGDSGALLQHAPALAATTATIVQAAARRTPVVLVGATPHIGAMAAQRVTSASSAWVFSAIQDDTPTTSLALKRLGLTSWASLAWMPDDESIDTLVRALVADLDA